MGKLVNGVWVDWIEKVKVLQKAVIKNEDGLFLALKRPANTPVRPDCWDLPGGSVEVEQITKWKEKSGKGDRDDILVNSIQEEISQETQLSVSEIKAIHSASGFNTSKGVFIVAIGYSCKVAPNSEQLTLSDEHSEYKWVSLDELKTLHFGDDGGLILLIIEKINN